MKIITFGRPDQRENTMGKALALHMAGLGSNAGNTYGPLNLRGVIPK